MVMVILLFTLLSHSQSVNWIFSHGKFGLLSLRKASCDSHATQPYLITSLVYAVFLCVHITGCEASFTTDGYGIFNLHTHLGACCTHEGGSGTNNYLFKSAQLKS